MSLMTTPSEFGQRVRNELAENGWIRYDPYSPEGSCLMGASATVNLTTGFYPWTVYDQWVAAMEEKARELEPALRCCSRPIPFFNDQVLLDRQDALNFVDKVIAGLQEQGR